MHRRIADQSVGKWSVGFIWDQPTEGAAMTVESGFDTMQAAVNVPPDDLREARRRRDLFRSALESFEDVIEVRPSGSLARGTHKNPVNDVDLVVVFRESDHEDWGVQGTSALVALQHLRDQANEKLGSKGSGEVRHTRIRNHSVKCFLDDPDDTAGFTVDLTPAFAREGTSILIPEQLNEKWVMSDPGFLIKRVAERHAEWNEFAKLVRVLKRWNTDHGQRMKSLTTEVLALHLLPKGERPQSLASFFAAAQEAVWRPIVDPSGFCGEIEPNLDREAASAELAKAADLAARAVAAQSRDEGRTAQCLWAKLFGEVYPEPFGGCGSLISTTASGAAAVAAVPKRRVVDSPQG